MTIVRRTFAAAWARYSATARARWALATHRRVALSVGWTAEPGWARWPAFDTVSTRPFGRAVSVVTEPERLSGTTYPLA